MSDNYSRYKDLISLALTIIRNDGLLFFLRSAYVEFRRNGFKILEKEISLIEEYSIKDDPEAYSKWMKLSHEYDETIDFKINPSKKSPFDVIVSFNEDKNEIEKTVNSVSESYLENINMFFLKRDSKIIASDVSSNIDFQNYNDIIQFITKTDSEYVIFIKPGCILTPNSLSKLQLFLENNDADIVYGDEDEIDSFHVRRRPFFKPDWSPELFLSMDYFSNFFIVKKQFLLKNNNGFDYFSFYDLLLRLTENNTKIFHIADVLVSVNSSVLPMNRINENGIALKNALQRRKINATISLVDADIQQNPYNCIHKITYSLKDKPLVSIIIPTKNNKKLLQRCIKNIKKKTSYKNYEIIIIDNNNSEQESIDYLNSLPYTKIKFDEVFNFAKMNNKAALVAKGDFLLFMNDDVAPKTNDWLTELVSIGLQKENGIVGPMLVYSNNSIQHGGMIFSSNGAGYHPFQLMKKTKSGYFGFLQTRRNYSGVTGACLLIKKQIFEQINGFDEIFDVYYNDADLCMKVLNKQYKIVYTPYTHLLHDGSTTIKKESDAFFAVENHFDFLKKWPKLKKGDPYYNPNLDWNFHINTEKISKPY